MSYIPNTLREHRKRAGLRQRDVANKLNILGVDRISRWERGLAYPSVPNLFKLAEVYNVPVEFLYPVKGV
jgi:transcriptional regulator with XRE-family HTH domain